MNILNIGSLNIDYVYHVDEFVQPGETKTSSGLDVNCGGKGLNQSIAAAKAGNEVWHAGLIGPEGQFLADKLAENNVNISLVDTVQNQNGHAIIQVNQHGQNCILLYAGTNRMLTQAYIDKVLDQFGEEGAVLLQNEVNELSYIIEQAHKRGLKIFLNAAPMDSNVLNAPLALVDWLMVNEVEGCQIAGCSCEEDILPTLRRKYPTMSILLTLGSKGAVYCSPEETIRVSACRVPVVDTTAAGDTFCGYFIYGILHQMEPAEILKLATCASAICVGRVGASESVPSIEEIRGILSRQEIVLPEIKRS